MTVRVRLFVLVFAAACAGDLPDLDVVDGPLVHPAPAAYPGPKFLELGAIAGASSSPTGSTVTPEQAEALVAAHNAVRATAVPAPVEPLAPLVWDVELARSAQAWADMCKFRHSPTPRGPHAGDPDAGFVGENVYAATGGTSRTVDAAVGRWASEAAHYDLDHRSCDEGKACGHYTAIVWETTTHVGCGVSHCKPVQETPWEEGSVLVCQYDPGGNFPGRAPYASASSVETASLH